MTHHAQNAPTALTISGVSIRQDEKGRYCLNDLHRAAGGQARHKPGNWLQCKQTIDLIREFEIAGIPAIQSKQGLGTFVHKHLVYDYAMWISAAFKVKVIRAYDALAHHLSISHDLTKGGQRQVVLQAPFQVAQSSGEPGN
jgi:hypothetical protein